MPSSSQLLVVFFVLLGFSAFFSASEASLIALNKVRLRHLVERKKRGAHRVHFLVSRMDKLIATILVGNNLANTGIAAIGTILISRALGEGRALVAGTLIITVILVIFGELIPKVIATNHPEGVAFLVRHLIHFFMTVFRPITYVLTQISNGFIRLFGGNPHFRSPLVTEEEMKMMIQIGKEEGFYGDNERKMLERIFHFDETEVRDVMTPIDRVIAIPIDAGDEELERITLEEGHNRLPVYRGFRSDIVGIIYVRDLVYLFKNRTLIRIEDLMNAPFFVSPHKKVAELLRDFQRRKVQIAIVQDTVTKKATGLVTLEDLIEEIVGELEEEDTALK